LPKLGIETRSAPNNDVAHTGNRAGNGWDASIGAEAADEVAGDFDPAIFETSSSWCWKGKVVGFEWAIAIAVHHSSEVEFFDEIGVLQTLIPGRNSAVDDF